MTSESTPVALRLRGAYTASKLPGAASLCWESSLTLRAACFPLWVFDKVE